MLESRRVRVDGEIETRANTPIAEGQKVTVGNVRRKTVAGFQILYKDSDLIVINKPVGLLSVPLDQGNDSNVLDGLRAHFRTDDIYAVHRIDRGTSGVMVFARGKRSTQKLAHMFREHDFERKYLAVVQGHLKKDQGTWKSFLLETPHLDVKVTKDQKAGRLSITHFKVLRRSKALSYLELSLETGRKHQIRVHCQAAGHPIVGDKRYGDEALDPFKRLALHASLIRFVHPHTNKTMVFEAPPPRLFVK